MIETTKYTEGYTTESLVLPYPWQTDLPDTTAERFEAIKQWVSLVTQSPYASQMLRDAWHEEQRKAAVKRVEELDTERRQATMDEVTELKQRIDRMSEAILKVPMLYDMAWRAGEHYSQHDRSEPALNIRNEVLLLLGEIVAALPPEHLAELDFGGQVALNEFAIHNESNAVTSENAASTPK